MTEPKTGTGASPTGAVASKPCPICGKPAEPRWRPFCSKHCADVDLHRWFTGVYSVPAEEDDTPPDEEGCDGAPP